MMMIRIYRWTLLWLAGIGLSGCGGMATTVTATVAAATPTTTVLPNTPTPVPIATSTLAPTPQATLQADVVLIPDQAQSVTAVKVGQIINLAAATDFEWVVSYRLEILLALTPEEAMSQPGAEGWFFQVIAPGTTELVLESKAVPCPGDAPCAPNVLRFVFPIEAVP